MNTIAAWWQLLLVQFCKVEIVCWAGDPNWLGWIALFFGSLFAISVVFWVITVAYLSLTD